MKILMVSAEATPFAKTGGLADVVSALSKTLSLMGHEVKVLLPRYYSINRNELSLVKKSILLNIGPSEIPIAFYSKEENQNLTYYFVDYERLFGREGVYGHGFEPDYRDNPLRFSVLCRSAFTLCKVLDWNPDIIHSHDWSSSFCSVLLKYFERPYFKNTKSVLTIHNMGYQGSYPGGAFKLLGLPDEYKEKTRIESFGGINFLQAGIIASDMITTVSASYAKEIQTIEGGFGLDGLMRIIGNELKGIVNGVDLSVWNPKIDKLIPANYSIDDFSGKSICKSFLQKKYFGYSDESIPVIGIINRFAEQKGIRELFEPNYGCMYRICKDFNVQVIVAGSGEYWCEQEIQNLSRILPNLKCFVGYNENMSHEIEAGADYFLMASKYEPCGLNQMYSMIYGTLPIVHATGGLDDTVENFDEDTVSGTGFKFYDLNPDSVYNTVKWALSVFDKKDIVRKLQINGMSKDFSWQKSAEKYISVYKREC